MTDFEKARDEASLKVFEGNFKGEDAIFQAGADWANNRCQEEMGELDAEIIFLKNDLTKLQTKADKLAEALERWSKLITLNGKEFELNGSLPEMAKLIEHTKIVIKEYRGEE